MLASPRARSPYSSVFIPKRQPSLEPAQNSFANEGILLYCIPHIFISIQVRLYEQPRSLPRSLSIPLLRHKALHGILLVVRHGSSHSGIRCWKQPGKSTTSNPDHRRNNANIGCIAYEVDTERRDKHCRNTIYDNI